MARMRLLLLAALALAIAVQGAASIAAGRDAGVNASPTAAHDTACHDHSDEEASGAVHCELCSSASIAPKPTGSIFARGRNRLASAILNSRSNPLPHQLDRPPQAVS